MMTARPNSFNTIGGTEFPKKFLIFIFGLFLIFVELALAEWTFFFGASPMLSLCYIFVFGLVKPSLVTPITVIAMGLVLEMMGGDMLGARAISYYAVMLYLQTKINKIEQEEFLGYWTIFSVICILISLFRAIIFAGLYFVIPDFSTISLQTGFTILLFPAFFVIITRFFGALDAPTSPSK